MKTIIVGLILITAILIIGAGITGFMTGTPQVKNGDTVEVNYKGTLNDGSIFDSSYPRGETLKFEVGKHQMIPGFEKAVIGMRVGEKRTVKIPPEEAYGQPNPQYILTVKTSELTQNNITPEVGIQLQTEQGMSGTVTKTDETDTVIDFNHPLAGQTLTFEIELMKIN